MSYQLILPFFPEELRELLLDPSISDLMINGTTGVYADRGGVVQHIPLTTPYTNDRLQAAIERVARILGQDLTSQNPILNTRLPDGSRVLRTIVRERLAAASQTSLLPRMAARWARS